MKDRMQEPRQPNPKKEPLVFVTSAPNEVIANMWADILEQHGIHVLVKHGPVTSYAASFGESIEIHALASQANEAKEILKPFIEPD